MKSKDLVKRVDELIEMGNNALSTRHHNEYSGECLDSGAIKGFRAAALSFIDRVYGSHHPHFTEFEHNTKDYYPGDAEKGIAILNAIHSEIVGIFIVYD